MRQAQQAAFQVLREKTSPVISATVKYHNRGSVLAMLTALQVQRLVSVLVSFKHCMLYCPEAGFVSTGSLESLVSRPIKLTGYLGEFEVYCQVGGYETAIGDLSQNKNGKFDIILDGLNSDLVLAPVAPPGYISITDQTTSIDLLDELYAYRDGWQKPKYFAYEPSICGHVYKGVKGCDRCIQVCPAMAIISTKQGIDVNPNLCRGCGECSVVCPSGAIRYRYPDSRLLLEGLHMAMYAFQVKSDQPLNLLLTESNIDNKLLEHLPENLIPLTLHSIASVDISFLLTVLATGWNSILFDLGGYYPGHKSDVLEQQNKLVVAILGHDEADVRIRYVNSLESVDTALLPALGSPKPEAYRGWPANKRILLCSAIQKITLPIREMTSVSLNEGSPFGDILVDAEQCTRCFSCVQICPVDALKEQDSALLFVEKDCIQCGLCVSGCPEKVVSLVPRFFPQALLSDRPVEKAGKTEQVYCVQCGCSFMSKKLLASLEEKMKGVGVSVNTPSLDYLKVCPDCRGKETLGRQIIHREVDQFTS